MTSVNAGVTHFFERGNKNGAHARLKVFLLFLLLLGVVVGYLT